MTGRTTTDHEEYSIETSTHQFTVNESATVSDLLDQDGGGGGGGSGDGGHNSAANSSDVYVPDDFDTVADALDALGEWASTHGESVNIIIESGHDIQEPVSHTQADYRMVSIRSEDDTVYLDSSFPSGRNVFQFSRYSTAPRFDILVDGEGHGERCYQIIFNSDVHFYEGAGATDFDVGVSVVQNSRGFVEGGVFTDCERRGVHVVNNAWMQAHNCDVSGAGEFGFRTSASRLDLIQADATNCGENGLRVMQAGTVQARAIDVSNSDDIGLSATIGCSVSAEDITAENCSGHGILCEGSDVYARGNNLSGNGGDDVHVTNGGIVRGGSNYGSTNIPTNELTSDGIIFS